MHIYIYIVFDYQPILLMSKAGAICRTSATVLFVKDFLTKLSTIIFARISKVSSAIPPKQHGQNLVEFKCINSFSSTFSFIF